MLTYLRYVLATICFALSAASLGLWVWAASFEWCVPISKHKEFIVTVFGGCVSVEVYTAGAYSFDHCLPGGIPLPLATLAAALAGIAILRTGRR